VMQNHQAGMPERLLHWGIVGLDDRRLGTPWNEVYTAQPECELPKDGEPQSRIYHYKKRGEHVDGR
jgi:hypothetical protein